MQQERTDHQDVTATSEAVDLPGLLAEDLRGVGGQPATPMRSRHDPERTVVGAAIIEVRSRGDERFQHGNGWLDVQDPFLLGPPDALGMRDPLLDWNAQILMGRHEPVPVRRLFEQRALDGHSAGGKQTLELGVCFKGDGKISAPRQIE